MFVCCLFSLFLFFPLFLPRFLAHNLGVCGRWSETPGSLSGSTDACDGPPLVASDTFEWNNDHSRIRTLLSLACFQRKTKNKNHTRVLLPWQSSHFLCIFCTFLQRTTQGSIVPRNVLTSFAHKHTNTRAPIMHACSFVRLPADSVSDVLPPLRLVEARLAKFSVAKKQNKRNPQTTK